MIRQPCDISEQLTDIFSIHGVILTQAPVRPALVFSAGDGESQDKGKRKLVKPKKLPKKQVVLAEKAKCSCDSLEELAPPSFRGHIEGGDKKRNPNLNSGKRPRGTAPDGQLTKVVVNDGAWDPLAWE